MSAVVYHTATTQKGVTTEHVFEVGPRFTSSSKDCRHLLRNSHAVFISLQLSPRCQTTAGAGVGGEGGGRGTMLLLEMSLQLSGILSKFYIRGGGGGGF